MNVAIIPARGGSKRIPRKNIRDFCGKPMIARSINTALNSKCFDKVIVSTDDKEIASVAEQYGAEVFGMRPPELSDDYCGTTNVIRYEIQKLISRGIDLRYVCELYATTPLLSASDIRGSMGLVNNSNQFIFSALKFNYPVQRSFYLKQNGVQMLFPNDFSKRSQDLPDVYHDAGQFYWGGVEAWLSKDFVFGTETQPYVLPPNSVVDIDTSEDWELAERMYERLGI